jgi:hypothetical protein
MQVNPRQKKKNNTATYGECQTIEKGKAVKMMLQECEK